MESIFHLELHVKSYSNFYAPKVFTKSAIVYNFILIALDSGHFFYSEDTTSWTHSIVIWKVLCEYLCVKTIYSNHTLFLSKYFVRRYNGITHISILLHSYRGIQRVVSKIDDLFLPDNTQKIVKIYNGITHTEYTSYFTPTGDSREL